MLSKEDQAGLSLDKSTEKLTSSFLPTLTSNYKRNFENKIAKCICHGWRYLSYKSKRLEVTCY